MLLQSIILIYLCYALIISTFSFNVMLLFSFLHLVAKCIPSQIHIDSHSSVNPCPVFYLKVYLQYTEPFRKRLDGSHVTSLFWGNNRQHMPVIAKNISSWVRKALYIAKAHVWVLSGLLQPQQLVFPWHASCRHVTGPEFLHQVDAVFPPISLLQIGIRILSNMLYWASVSRWLIHKCQTLTYIKPCEYWAISLPSTKEMVSQLSMCY